MKIADFFLYFLLLLVFLPLQRSVPDSLSCSKWIMSTKNLTEPSFLHWDTQSQQCYPTEICGGVNLLQIPDFDKRLPVSLLCPSESSSTTPLLSRLYDQKAIKQCFQQKKVCVLGDSTLEETIHDMVVLLSGIGINRGEVLRYYRSMRFASNPVNMVFDNNKVQLELKGTILSFCHHALLTFSFYSFRVFSRFW
jgi:hypothetical protein